MMYSYRQKQYTQSSTFNILDMWLVIINAATDLRASVVCHKHILIFKAGRGYLSFQQLENWHGGEGHKSDNCASFLIYNTLVWIELSDILEFQEASQITT